MKSLAVLLHKPPEFQGHRYFKLENFWMWRIIGWMISEINI